MAGTDVMTANSLLEREERALQEKKTALKSAGAALEAWRKAEEETRRTFAQLRRLGYGQKDLTDAFALTRGEAADLFPRKPRKGSVAEAPAASDPHESGEPVEGAGE